MKSPIIKLGSIAIHVWRLQRHHRPIVCGGPDWSARHWFWRFYRVESESSRLRRILAAFLPLALLCVVTMGAQCSVRNIFAPSENLADNVIINADRGISYFDSGLDITIALYDEGKISNATAQAFNKTIKRSAQALEVIFNTAKGARAASRTRLVVTSSARALMEGKLASIESDLVALSVPDDAESSTRERISKFLFPLREAISSLRASLSQIKLSNTQTGPQALVSLSRENADKLDALQAKFDAFNKEAMAWTVN